MSLSVIGPATGLFAVTNIDDLVILALFFGQGAGHKGATRAIAVGQYAGFGAILAVAAAAAFGATFLPGSALPDLGLLPPALGVRAAVQAWRHRGDAEKDETVKPAGPRIMEVAALSFGGAFRSS